MEARFIKGELEKLLETEIFLDSDGATAVLRREGPDVLQLAIYFQLTRRHVDASVAADDDALWEALREAAAGKCVMLIVDDAWDKSHVKAFSVLDDESGSCLVITTRLQGLVAGASEFELGILEADDAAALMLEVAGEHDIKPPYPKLVLDAVELCGRLPLVLSIAGGMLEEHGGEVDEDFIKILSEEHMESIRVGEKGDELVTIEDRLTHDNAIMSALVVAVGVEEAVAHAMGVHAAAGRNIDAARWLVAVSGTRISKVMSHDVLQRAESLLSEVGKDQIRGGDNKLIEKLVGRIIHHVPVDEMQAIFKKWNKAELFDIKTASATAMMTQYVQDIFVKMDFLFEAEGGDAVPAEQLKVIVDFGYEWRGLSTNA
eukprot:g5235.t1